MERCDSVKRVVELVCPGPRWRGRVAGPLGRHAVVWFNRSAWRWKFVRCYGKAVFNQRARLVSHERLLSSGHKLAVARLTLVVLFAMAGMAIFLIPVRSTLRAR